MNKKDEPEACHRLRLSWSAKDYPMLADGEAFSRMPAASQEVRSRYMRALRQLRVGYNIRENHPMVVSGEIKVGHGDPTLAFNPGGLPGERYTLRGVEREVLTRALKAETPASASFSLEYDAQVTGGPEAGSPRPIFIGNSPQRATRPEPACSPPWVKSRVRATSPLPAKGPPMAASLAPTGPARDRRPAKRSGRAFANTQGVGLPGWWTGQERGSLERSERWDRERYRGWDHDRMNDWFNAHRLDPTAVFRDRYGKRVDRHSTEAVELSVDLGATSGFHVCENPHKFSFSETHPEMRSPAGRKAKAGMRLAHIIAPCRRCPPCLRRRVASLIYRAKREANSRALRRFATSFWTLTWPADVYAELMKSVIADAEAEMGPLHLQPLKSTDAQHGLIGPGVRIAERPLDFMQLPKSVQLRRYQRASTYKWSRFMTLLNDWCDGIDVFSPETTWREYDRKRQHGLYKSVRYIGATELGEQKGRFHDHCLLFFSRHAKRTPTHNIMMRLWLKAIGSSATWCSIRYKLPHDCKNPAPFVAYSLGYLKSDDRSPVYARVKMSRHFGEMDGDFGILAREATIPGECDIEAQMDAVNARFANPSTEEEARFLRELRNGVKSSDEPGYRRSDRPPDEEDEHGYYNARS